MTRFQYIKGLDIDEMAQFFDVVGDCSFCSYFTLPKHDCKGKKCLDGIKTWLSTEVDALTRI